MADRKYQTAVSDEQIISALLNSGSIAQAAEQTGLSPRTIYDRMGTRDFRSLYSAAKSDIIRNAVLTMNRNLSAAVEAVTEIMKDKNNAAGTRLQAAKMLIEAAAKFTDRIDNADRYTAEMAEPALSLNFTKF